MNDLWEKIIHGIFIAKNVTDEKIQTKGATYTTKNVFHNKIYTNLTSG